MSGDHNMNQTTSGWRKRQIALDKKAENARELGLDYEPNKTVIEMAREAGGMDGWGKHKPSDPELSLETMVFDPDDLERFAELVRAKERDSWPAEMEAMERQVNILSDELAKAKAEEREKFCAVLRQLHDSYSLASDSNNIKARGQA